MIYWSLNNKYNKYNVASRAILNAILAVNPTSNRDNEIKSAYFIIVFFYLN